MDLVKAGGKQDERHLNRKAGCDPAPEHRNLMRKNLERGVSPGTFQGGQVGALSGHLAGQGEEFHPPQ